MKVDKILFSNQILLADFSASHRFIGRFLVNKFIERLLPFLVKGHLVKNYYEKIISFIRQRSVHKKLQLVKTLFQLFILNSDNTE